MTQDIPFTLNNKILNLISKITKILGQFEGIKSPKPKLELRKKNRIKSIHGSLAIEGNTLSIEQITDIMDSKRVIGPKIEILEVTNAIKLYEASSNFKPFKIDSLLKAHKMMMNGIIEDAGKFRNQSVGIYKKGKISHLAPKAQMVPKLIDNLFNFLKTNDTHEIIKSCVFHYEFEFIHPFSDGNGRLGRFWQYLLLLNYHPLFEYVPIESQIKKYQSKYYDSLELSDRNGNSNPFIEFSLNVILESLSEFFENLKPEPLTPIARLEMARTHFFKNEFKRKDYIIFFKTISTATASRDLEFAFKNGILKKSGEKAITKYKFIK